MSDCAPTYEGRYEIVLNDVLEDYVGLALLISFQQHREAVCISTNMSCNKSRKKRKKKVDKRKAIDHELRKAK